VWRFWDARLGRARRLNCEQRRSIWAGPFRVHGPGWPNPDMGVWSDAGFYLGACVLAQHPELRLVHCWGERCEPLAEIAFDPRRNYMVADTWRYDPGFNRLYVLAKSVAAWNLQLR